MNIQRVLLAPFAWIYAGVLAIRHALYDRGLKKSTRPTIPAIVVGNLALGGTGKTPHVELVLRILAQQRSIATLSRGYGRNSTGFREVSLSDHPGDSGDEPLQVKQKFPDVRVFVGADRVKAIKIIEKKVTGLDAVILDDAFQHRRLKAGLNIVLTTWQRPWHADSLLPAGRLRDIPSRAKAAQIVVVTKCPTAPSLEQQQHWRKALGLLPAQHLFFTGIEYGGLEPLLKGSMGSTEIEGISETRVLLVTGIADPRPLVDHLRSRFPTLEHVSFPDHHAFRKADLTQLAGRIGKFAPGPKLLVTTEKDAVRLRPLIANGPLQGIPMAVIGMRAVVLNEPERFGALIKEHAGPDKADR